MYRDKTHQLVFIPKYVGNIHVVSGGTNVLLETRQRYASEVLDDDNTAVLTSFLPVKI